MIELRLRKSDSGSDREPDRNPDGGPEARNLDGRTILVRHKSGDAFAFEELMKLYRAPVYGYLIRCGVAAGARDDLFQEIFLKIHHACDVFDAKRSLSPWVFTIVVNTVRSFYQKLRIQTIIADNDLSENTASSAAETESIIDARQTQDWLESEIKKLTLAQREAIILCCIENMEQADAAKALAIPLGTLKTNLRRARLALTRCLVRRNAKMLREVSAV